MSSNDRTSLDAFGLQFLLYSLKVVRVWISKAAKQFTHELVNPFTVSVFRMKKAEHSNTF